MRNQDNRRDNQRDQSPAGAGPLIRETIVREAGPKSPLWKRFLLVAGLGVTFGLSASLAMLAGGRLFHGGAETTPAYESVTFPQDDPGLSTPPEDPGGSIRESQTAPDPETTQCPEHEEAIRAYLEKNPPGAAEYQKMYQALGAVVTGLNRSMVTVTSSTSDTDWFNLEYRRNTRTCGVIVAITSQEILILTPAEALSGITETNPLRLTFGNGVSAAAYIKETDRLSGLTVIAATKSNLSETTQSYLQPISLGNSYGNSIGQPVIALGGPLGYNRSVLYGMISYIETEVQSADANHRILHTNMPCREDSYGFLVNLEGELVGWMDADYFSNGMITAIGISSLKGTIESLSNGKSIGYLGIEGQTVTTEIMEAMNFPQLGVYVTRCLDASPALAAGLQSGDVIIELSEKPIASMRDLQNCLREMTSVQRVELKALRASGGSYTVITFDVYLERR